MDYKTFKNIGRPKLITIQGHYYQKEMAAGKWLQAHGCIQMAAGKWLQANSHRKKCSEWLPIFLEEKTALKN